MLWRLLAAGLVIATTGGCSEFFDKADATDTAPDTAGETDATDGVDGDVTGLDVPDVPGELPDVTEVPDGDGEIDAPQDVDVDAGEVDTVECIDACPSAGASQCSEDSSAIETCFRNDDGCLEWRETTTCTDDTDMCRGPVTCQDDGGGAECVEDTSMAVECTGTPCIPEVCVPATGLCDPRPIPENGACDDGDPCTATETCNAAGECVGFASQAECPCSVDSDCDQFDDGDLCNGRYECTDVGGCFPIPPPDDDECTANPNPCKRNVVSCDPGTGAVTCVEENLPDDTSCIDDDECSLTSSCQVGVCTGDEFKMCPADVCEESSCNPLTGQCSVEAIPVCCGNGTPEADEGCDDGDDDETNTCLEDCSINPCQKRAVCGGAGTCGWVDTGIEFPATLGELTVEFLLKPDAPGAEDQVLVSRSNATGGTQWELVILGNAVPADAGKLAWREEHDSGTVEVIGFSPPVNQWRHIAVTREVIGGQAVIRWFFAGIKQSLDSAPFDITNVVDLPSNADLFLGCKLDAESVPTASYLGCIDEVRVSEGLRYSGNYPPPSTAFVSDGTTIGLWHFDDATSGGAFYDSGPDSHHGFGIGWSVPDDQGFASAQAKSACPAVSTCSESALELDGTGYAGTTSVPDAMNSQSLTVEFFLRADANTKAVILSRSGPAAGAADWHIEAGPGAAGTVQVRWLEGQTPTLDNATSTDPLTVGQWYHLAVQRSFNDATDTVSVKWFVNGVGDNVSNVSGKALATSQPLTFGAYENGTLPFDGAIDDVRISSDLVYPMDFTPPCQAEIQWNTAAVYRFDEGTRGFSADAINGNPVVWLDGDSVLGDGDGAADIFDDLGRWVTTNRPTTCGCP